VHHKSIIYNKPTRCNSGSIVFINPLTPNDLKKRRTAQLTSRHCIFIYLFNKYTY